MDIFISYAHEDKAFVEALRTILELKGYTIWQDTRHIRGGDDWEDEIENAIKSCEVFLLILSKKSINKESFVHLERKAASRLKKKIVPVKIMAQLDYDAVSAFLANYQIIDFHISKTSNYDAQLKQVLDALGEPTKLPKIVDTELHQKVDALMALVQQGETDRTSREKKQSSLAFIIEQLIDEFNIANTYLETSDLIHRFKDTGLINEEQFQNLGIKLLQNDLYNRQPMSHDG